MTIDLRARWRRVLLSVAVFGFGLSIARVLLAPGVPTVSADAAFFQHAGWYVTQGAVPYVDIWDIKPPLAIELTTLLALLSFGNMTVLHLLSVAATTAAGIATVALVGELTHEITGDELASLAAGLTVLTLAGVHSAPATGFHPKYFAMALGLLGILLALRDAPFAAGAAAAAGAGFMQHGVIFAVLTFGLVVQTRSAGRIRRVVGGMAATTALAVTPIVLLGGGGPMLVEVVLVPLSASEETGILAILGNLQRGFLFLGYAAVPVLLGLYGVVRVGLLDRADVAWWVAGGAAIAAVQILFVDFDGYADLFFGLLFVALGVGLLVDRIDERPGYVVTGTVALVVAISVFAMGGFGVVSDPIDDVHVAIQEDRTDTALLYATEYVQSLVGVEDQYTGPTDDPGDPLLAASPYDQSDVVRLFWNKVEPTSCHYRLSATELQWVEQTGRSITAERCGQFPP